jgi:1,4-alpha-glucan branching enzyme
MKTGTTVPYATKRINQHILQFNKIYDDLRANKLQATANDSGTVRWLADVEARDNIFPNIDYRIYAS